ncbi:MAG: glucuronoxylanase XynC [Calditrichota bacterium]
MKRMVNYFLVMFLLSFIFCRKDTTEVETAIPNSATIHLESTQQVIRGFGAANIVSWRPDMTPEEINTAFGTGDGQLGFSILRLRIPWQQSDFSINVPSAKAAYDMGVKIIASPWTPPPEMKTSNDTVGGRLKDDSYPAYAAHLKAFVDYMANNGVPIHAISVQNEPDVTVTYESCDWNASEMLRFMKENAPDVGTAIFCAESFNFNHSMTNPVLNDPIASANTAFIGGHIYGGGLTRYPLAEAKSKEIWMTEYLELSTDWEGALATAKSINDCMNANMSAYIWWYIVRFYGPIYDDDSRRPPGTEKGEISKRGYAMSQYSRFIRPGYYRVDATANPQAGVYVSAYRGSSNMVIVAINYGSQPVDQTFIISGETVKTFRPYVTSEIKNCQQEKDINVSERMFADTLDASSITTFVSE